MFRRAHLQKPTNLLATGGAACRAAGGERACLSSSSPRSASILDTACFGEPRSRTSFPSRSPPRVRRLLRSRGTGFSSCRDPSHGVSARFNLNGELGALARTSPIRRRSAATRRTPPGVLRVVARQTNAPHERFRARQHAIKTGHKCPSALSSSVYASAPPETSERATTALPCLAAERLASPPPRPGASSWSPLGSRPLLLAPRSHALAFESPGWHCQAPGTTPAARPLPRLVTVFAHSVTSVEGLPLRLLSYVPGSRPAIVSAHLQRGAAISAYETRSSAYPPTTTLPCSATSPSELTDKPLRAFHG
jgi:hypothetical protein